MPSCAALDRREKRIAFLLCGEAARKERLIDAEKHAVICVPDPADEEFLGSRPFSAINNALSAAGSRRYTGKSSRCDSGNKIGRKAFNRRQQRKQRERLAESHRRYNLSFPCSVVSVASC